MSPRSNLPTEDRLQFLRRQCQQPPAPLKKARIDPHEHHATAHQHALPDDRRSQRSDLVAPIELVDFPRCKAQPPRCCSSSPVPTTGNSSKHSVSVGLVPVNVSGYVHLCSGSRNREIAGSDWPTFGRARPRSLSLTHGPGQLHRRTTGDMARRGRRDGRIRRGPMIPSWTS